MQDKLRTEDRGPKTEDRSRKPEAERATLDEALASMRDLRARDAWDRAQTHDSLRPYLGEEIHELDDAIRSGDDAAMRSELGDVLLQVLFHAIIAEERGAFNIGDVAGSLVAKMTKRHPWLYGDAPARAIFLHGNRPSTTPENAAGYLAQLGKLAKTLGYRFAVPMAKDACIESATTYCWRGERRENLERTWNAVTAAASRCFGDADDFGVIGFSNGG